MAIGKTNASAGGGAQGVYGTVTGVSDSSTLTISGLSFAPKTAYTTSTFISKNYSVGTIIASTCYENGTVDAYYVSYTGTSHGESSGTWSYADGTLTISLSINSGYSWGYERYDTDYKGGRTHYYAIIGE